jgi:hypothetical protein
MDDYHFGYITKILKRNLPETGKILLGEVSQTTPCKQLGFLSIV